MKKNLNYREIKIQVAQARKPPEVSHGGNPVKSIPCTSRLFASGAHTKYKQGTADHHCHRKCTKKAFHLLQQGQKEST